MISIKGEVTEKMVSDLLDGYARFRTEIGDFVEKIPRSVGNVWTTDDCQFYSTMLVGSIVLNIFCTVVIDILWSSKSLSKRTRIKLEIMGAEAAGLVYLTKKGWPEHFATAKFVEYLLEMTGGQILRKARSR
jgi:hypothetical protein